MNRLIEKNESCIVINEYRWAKRTIIKEEFIALTDNIVQSLILDYFLYQIAQGNSPFEDCWFSISAKTLKEELMLNVHPNTINRHLTKLVKRGILKRRHDPDYKWNRTWQYQLNIPKIETELNKLGYTLIQRKEASNEKDICSQ